MIFMSLFVEIYNFFKRLWLVFPCFLKTKLVASYFQNYDLSSLSGSIAASNTNRSRVVQIINLFINFFQFFVNFVHFLFSLQILGSQPLHVLANATLTNNPLVNVVADVHHAAMVYLVF